MKKIDIGLCVPVIYCGEYFEKLVELNKKYMNNNCYIYEVYGSLQEDIVGNLRPPFAIKPIDEYNLKKILTFLKSHGISFNYVMNSTVAPLPGQNIFLEEFIAFVTKLEQLGIERVTITSPFLLSVLKKHFPKMKVEISVCNEISNLCQVKEFESIGADVLILDRDINRNFALLESIINNTKKNLKLLCNSSCVFQCINVQYHANYSSFLSNMYSLTKNTNDAPFCSSYCKLKKFSNLKEHIKSPWIRPEDIHTYNELGISLFKLDGRDSESNYMLEVIEAYLNQRFEGNFLHLLKRHYPSNMEDIISEFDESLWQIGIDNRNLDGFIDDLVDKKKICDANCDLRKHCDNYIQHIIVNEKWQRWACFQLKNKMNVCM